ncbi:TMV resistance protein N [Tanacetum coccineum]|uniref:TMV resistance protein N n=1 Tax=Tanacetum coccineum TaxID=301880 RepID=A0ABQ5GUZ4_9ASTR
MSLTKTGNFIGLENLEELKLGLSENLEELDSSIGCLQKLVLLDLSGCKRLKRLPWKMIGKLTSLQTLHLRYDPNILEISHEIGSLTSLKHLNLGENKFNILPNSICQLHQLTTLELSKCSNLESIPNLPPNIESLYATYCIYLVNLPSNISELQTLKDLWLDNCLKLGSEGFTQVIGLRNLERLNMKNCNVSQVSSGIGNLVSLKYLDLAENPFKSLPESFSNLSQLFGLSVMDCSELQLLPPLPSQLTHIKAANCLSLDVMPFDSMQKAYIFRSKAFKVTNLSLLPSASKHVFFMYYYLTCLNAIQESRLMSTKGLYIGLSGEELPDWCTHGNSGNILSFVAPIQFDSKICGLILCANRDEYEYKDDEYEDKDDEYEGWICPVIYNKTKGTSHRFRDEYEDDEYDHDKYDPDKYEGWVMFYPFDGTTLVVEAGDTVEVDLSSNTKSCGLRWVYEDDVVDSGLVLKDVSITELNDEEVRPFPIPDDEYLSYNLSPWYLDLEQFVMQGIPSSSRADELA